MAEVERYRVDTLRYVLDKDVAVLLFVQRLFRLFATFRQHLTQLEALVPELVKLLLERGTVELCAGP